MPFQTTKTANVVFKDSAKVEVDPQDGSGYFDLGSITGDITNTLEWEENRVDSANAGPYKIQIRNQRMNGSFTLDNLDPEGIEKIGAGIFERASVSGAVDPADQVQTTPSVESVVELLLIDSTGNNLRPAAKPTITSVTGATTGALVEGTDYELAADESSASGWSIVYLTGSITGTEDVTIVYPSQSVVSSQTIYMGESTVQLSAYKMRFTHTDDNSKIRRLELFSTDPTSGGFNFNFGDPASDGVENMVVNFTAKADTALVSGRQLAAWTFETGAE
jgi:hypothetical protein